LYYTHKSTWRRRVGERRRERRGDGGGRAQRKAQEEQALMGNMFRLGFSWSLEPHEPVGGADTTRQIARRKNVMSNLAKKAARAGKQWFRTSGFSSA
jgi:hypothetical protein